MARPIALPRRQRGATLLEALVAFVFVAVATVAAGRAQTQLRLEADVARHRSEAVRIAAAELEDLRAFAALASASAARSYEALADAERSVEAGGARFRVVRSVDASAIAGATAATVRVEWSDRAGRAQAAALGSMVAAVDPTFGGALALAHAAGRTTASHGRAAGIPAASRSLGDGRSAWKANGLDVLVFGDAAGHVVAACRATVAQAALTAADLSGCTATDRLLVAGTIRFSDATPPVAAPADDPPLPVGVALALAGSGHAGSAACASDAMKTVRHVVADTLRIDAVPVDATPASIGAASWSDTGERFVAWRCTVPTRADGRWSGRVDLVASGWTIGTGSAERRVCRYSADQDGSGAIDSPAEHPAAYRDVAASLVAQNFLVVHGDQACPADPVDPTRVTVPHQP